MKARPFENVKNTDPAFFHADLLFCRIRRRDGHLADVIRHPPHREWSYNPMSAVDLAPG
jgi:hypothetical protein